MGFSGRSTQPDPDPVATQEWQDSIRAVEQRLGSDEAKRLLHATLEAAKQAGFLQTKQVDGVATTGGFSALAATFYWVLKAC